MRMVKSEEVNKEGFVKWFSELSNKDIGIAGGKGASLCEMYNNKFPIPPGFIITAQAYAHFIEKTGIKNQIADVLKDLDIEDTSALDDASKKIRAIIEDAQMPKELEEAIVDAYDILDVDKKDLSGASKTALDILKHSYEPPFVATRSSATTEDLADASFAGQQESFLNVKGTKDLLSKVKRVFSSLFTSRAIYYRVKKGFGVDKSLLAVVVQVMINSDKSGVMFSKNPVRDDGSLMIEAVWGLGEGIVSGMIKPDTYVVDRNMAKFTVRDMSIAEKKIAIVRDSSGDNKVAKLSGERSKQQVLSSYEIKRLAQYAMQLEEHYKKPQDIEFAINGADIFIVQSRPITTLGNMSKVGNDKKLSGKELLSGLGASPGVSSGTVKIVHTKEDLQKVKKGDVLVTEMTNPDMVVTMQRASAIVTNEGGITSHAAIVSREMGIPCVVGTGDATNKLSDGVPITVDGTNGKVYEGASVSHLSEIKPIVPTKTKIKVIVDLPNAAERAAQTHAKAVGLVRLEGIIASSGKHPVMFEKTNQMDKYEDIIYNGVKEIAKHFEEVWIRSSDLRSDEYGSLEGAPKNKEENPMLGDHGIRFTLKHPEILKAELRALKRLAEEFKDKHFGFMIPQVISVEEVKSTKDIAMQVKTPHNVKIGIMVETPAAVQLINNLCEEGIDFISFGTNDLTQYTLALDRNNTEVQPLYSEMHPAILASLTYVIRRCRKYKVETSICGQAASREEMARFLVGEGIDSISVNADAAFAISEIIAKIESGDLKKEVKEKIELDEDKKIVISNDSSVSLSENNKIDEIKEDAKEVKVEVKEEKNEMYTPVLTADAISFNPKMENIFEFATEKIAQKEVENSISNQQILESNMANEDIEDIVLKELEGDDSADYVPGSVGDNSGKDVPSLNDAIPVDSDHFNDHNDHQQHDKHKDGKVIDLGN